MPEVSIIVPIYNVEKYLDRCMQSLLNQTLKDIEIIMVDDGSPDRCPQMCDEYAKNDSRIKVVHKKNGGLGYARNSGLDVATGEYVAFIDSDDYTSTEAYETLYDEAKRGDFDIVYAGYMGFKSSGATFTDFVMDKELRGNDVIKFLGNMLYHVDKGFESVCMSMWNGIYRRDLINAHHVRFHSEREYLSEDILFHTELIPYCKSIRCIPKVFYHYCYNDTSLTRKFKLSKIRSNEALFNKVFEILKQNGLSQLNGRASHLFLTYTRGIILKEIILSDLKISDKKKYCDEVYNYKLWSSAIPLLRKMPMPLYERVIAEVIAHKYFFLNWLIYMAVYKVVGYNKF